MGNKVLFCWLGLLLTSAFADVGYARQLALVDGGVPGDEPASACHAVMDEIELETDMDLGIEETALVAADETERRIQELDAMVATIADPTEQESVQMEIEQLKEQALIDRLVACHEAAVSGGDHFLADELLEAVEQFYAVPSPVQNEPDKPVREPEPRRETADAGEQ